jgi:hypothetical protein
MLLTRRSGRSNSSTQQAGEPRSGPPLTSRSFRRSISVSKQFTPGDWIRRLQTHDYSVEAVGWVRVVAGQGRTERIAQKLIAPLELVRLEYSSIPSPVTRLAVTLAGGLPAASSPEGR